MFSRNILKILFGAAIMFVVASFASAQQGRANSIEGTIYDDSRNPVYNAYVELYSNFGQLIGRERSTSQGRFTFRGMTIGRYVIKVKPLGTNLLEDSQDVEVGSNFTQGDTAFVNFRLQKDKRFVNEQTAIVGTVYAQDIPENARSLFKSAIDNMKTNHVKALADLEEAVKIFPTYFDALAALGKANILDGKYEQGYPFLLRAVDVNKRCGDCFYTLSLAFYKLGEIPAGVKAADAAALLQQQVPAIRLLQGMLLFLNNDLPGAEKALLAAKSLFQTPDSDVYWYLSLVYNKTHRNKEAADALEQYIKVKPHIDESEKSRVKELIGKLRKATS